MHSKLGYTVSNLGTPLLTPGLTHSTSNRSRQRSRLYSATSIDREGRGENNKPKEFLRKASDFLASKITEKISEERLKSFGEGFNDVMIYHLRDGTSVYFHNIWKEPTEKTLGFL